MRVKQVFSKVGSPAGHIRALGKGAAAGFKAGYKTGPQLTAIRVAGQHIGNMGRQLIQPQMRPYINTYNMALRAAAKGSSFFTYTIPKGLVWIGNQIAKYASSVWKVFKQGTKFVFNWLRAAVDKVVKANDRIVTGLANKLYKKPVKRWYNSRASYGKKVAARQMKVDKTVKNIKQLEGIALLSPMGYAITKKRNNKEDEE